MGIGGRPTYTRQRSSEWELPYDSQSQPSGGKGKGKERECGNVGMPSEPDEAAYPLRSRSPRPISPRPYSDDPLGGDKRTKRARSPDLDAPSRTRNPFESEMDPERLSPSGAMVGGFWSTTGNEKRQEYGSYPGEDGDEIGGGAVGAHHAR